MTVKNVQIVTALERRRRWSEAEKATIVSETMEPGASVLAVARKYDVHPRCIYRWKEKLVMEAPVPVPAARALPPAPKKRGRKPKEKKKPPPAEVVPAPKVFAVEPPPPAPVSPAPLAPASGDGVRLVVGDLVITISTGRGS